MGSMNKKIASLGREDKMGVAIPIGTKRRPYPMKYMKGVNEATGTASLEYRLGSLKSDTHPMIIYADRSYAEVIGTLMREMPIPSMLPLLADSLDMRLPEHSRSLLYVEGAPGTGKTFLPEMIARVRNPKGAIKIDCGNKNLNDLLFETVLDFGSDRSFYDELEARVQSYNEAENDIERNLYLHAHSVQLLRIALGDAISIENNEITIDWQSIAESGLSDTAKEERMFQINKVLRIVGENERFQHTQENALGMASQEGPLIRAWKEGREIILDEFNRAKAGTTASLHTVLQFLTGEIDEVKVDNHFKNKQSKSQQHFIFRRKDQKLGFFVTATGNAEDDGSDVNYLAESLNSRMAPKIVPQADMDDWEHRICQLLTGLPISTIYKANIAEWGNNEELFEKKLFEWRVLGLRKEEIEKIPPHQMQLLGRYKDVMEASKLLAKFYMQWGEMIDLDSAYNKNLNGQGYPQYLHELDDHYKSKLTVDFRKLIQHINEAFESKPQAESPYSSVEFDADSWDEPPLIDFVPEEKKFSQIGTQLSMIILRNISETTYLIGKKLLADKLLDLAVDCKIVLRDITSNENGQALIANLLDIDSNDEGRQILEPELIRNLICELLRATDDKITLNNNEIISVSKVSKFLNDLSDFKEREASIEKPMQPEDLTQDAITEIETILDDTGITNSMIILNDDFDSFERHAFIRATSVTIDAQDIHEVLANDLVSKNAFLYSLLPARFRRGNLKAVWSEVADDATLYNEPIEGGAHYISDNISHTGLAVAGVTLRGNSDDGIETLRFVYNKKIDKALIIGQGQITPFLEQEFRRVNYLYVDNNREDSVSKIEEHLSAIVDEKYMGCLRNAFLLTHQHEDLSYQDNTELPRLLALREMKCLQSKAIINARISF
jgi:hypothetical protein